MANDITRGGSAVGALGTNKPPLLKATPDAYVSLGDLLDYNKPDNRDLLINTFGDQGITGFLQLTGAVKNAGVNDEVQWWEEGRLHPHVSVTTTGTVAANAEGTITVAQQGVNDAATTSSVNSYQVRVHDVLLTPGGKRLLITATTATAGQYKYRVLDGSAIGTAEQSINAAVIGNLYGQGSDQPSDFFQTDVTKRTNPYMIVKETYAVNGSQATNIGWVNLGGGDYRWYIKGEQDTRKRFMDKREMMLLFGQTRSATNGVTIGTDNKITGSEGYFAAVENRGLVADVSGGNQGTFAGLSDFDQIILELDKEGAPAEYAMYLNRSASLDIDDLLAQGIATQTTAGLAGQFGAFNNDADMAVKLGFKSFTRGGYTFHKHDWKLLNDPTTGGISSYKGAMVPMTKVTDARTGMKAPALEMNYKGTNGYNRDMEHWVMGSILGHSNMSKDVAEFYYRSECNLVTRAANQHVVIK